jgi:hypothetical protein
MNFWYDSTPTIMSADGVATYINCTDEHFPKDKDSQDYVKKALGAGDYPSIVHRAHVATMLKDVPQADIDKAGLKAATLDVAAPTSGTKEVKDAAVAEKLQAVVPVAEYMKLASLQASVVKDEKPVEIAPMEELAK